jgi:hypothetical protein
VILSDRVVRVAAEAAVPPGWCGWGGGGVSGEQPGADEEHNEGADGYGAPIGLGSRLGLQSGPVEARLRVPARGRAALGLGDRFRTR